jgi:hypothetical protein
MRAKGNVKEQSMHRTQSRVRVIQALITYDKLSSDTRGGSRMRNCACTDLWRPATVVPTANAGLEDGTRRQLHGRACRRPAPSNSIELGASGAQLRWTPRPPQDVPMTAIGVDVAQGGSDSTVLAPRYDTWYAPLIVVPRKETPTPSSAAALVVQRRRHGAAVIVDVGGGYGIGATTTDRLQRCLRWRWWHQRSAADLREQEKFLFARPSPVSIGSSVKTPE